MPATLETLLNDPGRAGVRNIVPDRSAITFKIKNMWGLLTVRGRFTEFSGDGQITARGTAAGRIDIRAASVNTGIGHRDEHLRSADFFDVARFPDISVAVNAVPTTEGNAADHRVDFTIKGVTAPLPLPLTFNALDDGSIQISGATEVDRSQFDLGWNRLGMMGETATVAAETVFVRVPR
jgi:polyisoprenoid-binding protein YceI